MNWVGRTPSSARDAPVPLARSKNQALPQLNTPARGPAADEGVRPTNYVRMWENYVALGFSLPQISHRSPEGELKSAPPLNNQGFPGPLVHTEQDCRKPGKWPVAP